MDSRQAGVLRYHCLDAEQDIAQGLATDLALLRALLGVFVSVAFVAG